MKNLILAWGKIQLNLKTLLPRARRAKSSSSKSESRSWRQRTKRGSPASMMIFHETIDYKENRGYRSCTPWGNESCMRSFQCLDISLGGPWVHGLRTLRTSRKVKSQDKSRTRRLQYGIKSMTNEKTSPLSWTNHLTVSWTNSKAYHTNKMNEWKNSNSWVSPSCRHSFRLTTPWKSLVLESHRTIGCWRDSFVCFWFCTFFIFLW